MPSRSFLKWNQKRLPELQPIEDAHAAIVGVGPGRRYVTQQINQAFVMLLSSQFQGFCRDLHSECVDILMAEITPAPFQILFSAELMRGRKLETGNPNPANFQNDFLRFGFDFQTTLVAHHPDNAARKATLEELNLWRNAIGHQDFTSNKLNNRSTISLAKVKTWRVACKGLAVSMDAILHAHLQSLLGRSPW